VKALKAWSRAQKEEHIAAGPAWQDTGLVFAKEDGSILHPQTLSGAFEHAAKAAGLPAIGIHGLRHGHASMGLAAGLPLVIVSERLGHSSTAIRGRLQPQPPKPAPGGRRSDGGADPWSWLISRGVDDPGESTQHGQLFQKDTLLARIGDIVSRQIPNDLRARKSQTSGPLISIRSVVPGRLIPRGCSGMELRHRTPFRPSRLADYLSASQPWPANRHQRSLMLLWRLRHGDIRRPRAARQPRISRGACSPLQASGQRG
jgi:hypothetical protein